MDRSEVETQVDRLRLLGPFAATVVATLALAMLPPGIEDKTLLVIATCCFLAVGGLVVALPWDRISSLSSLPVITLFTVGVVLLRHAGGGGSGSQGYSPLLLIPVIWLALRGEPFELWFSVGCAGVALGAPIVLIGSPLYPPAQWRLAVLTTLLAATIGAVVQRLITERQALLARLDALASKDELTGLCNRRGWNEALEHELGRAGHGPRRIHVALIDLDRFKEFNDRHGHLAGDAVLAEAATAWSTALRADDVLARWGGEEFVILLPHTTLPEAEAVLARMAAVTPAALTFSGGLVDATGMSGRDAVAAADHLLYAAKAAGRHCVLTSDGATLDPTALGA
ncbi:MAG: diguanylate cyclase [Acidimicrobiales bacterium]|nr:diguanylate cyclase [Acidimicrobiales bacterium]